MEVEWERKIGGSIGKKKLVGEFGFVEKQGKELEEIGQIEGEKLSDFMDYPEDYKRPVGFAALKAVFPMNLPLPFPFYQQGMEDPTAGYLSLGKNKKKKDKEKEKSKGKSKE